jgi:DNA-binding response OmpR family regulator
MPVPEGLSGSPRTKVVVIDDEPVVRDFMREIFRKYFPDFQFEEAADGFMAGTCVSSLKPQLVILDIMLPGLDGFEVCKYIRRHPELDGTKIIVVSGLSAGEAEEKILAMGADDYLEKPIDIEIFKEKIRTHLKISGSGGKSYGMAA